ncbi:hypothetical protein [Croceicoccus hydrothermalis]|uniref:hypothetical protein n=1 Tax=Croceicoccus hydrothermalis TaxID=2867964 RepID=UPI001EFB8101|nr:hypothetical protein [Croceicoccus hydrothermalis]
MAYFTKCGQYGPWRPAAKKLQPPVLSPENETGTLVAMMGPHIEHSEEMKDD